jgi:hypothetical protein
LASSFVVPAIVSLFVAVGSPLATDWVRWQFGEVRPLPPPVFCIARGLGPFESDALVLAMDWRNGRTESVQVSQPYLVVSDGSDGLARSDDERRTFVMVGSYPELDPSRFTYPYDRRTAFVLEPNSVSTQALIFRPYGYDASEGDEGRDFRFENGALSVGVGYQHSKGGNLKPSPPNDENVFVLRVRNAGADVFRSQGERNLAREADCWTREQRDPDRDADRTSAKSPER